MKPLRVLGLVACVALVGGCASLMRTEISKERALLEVDRAFAQIALEQGGAAAMRAMMAPTASMLSRREGEYIGADQAALAYPAPAAPSDQDVIYWGPEKAWVSGDESLGVTTGRYVRMENGAQREQGRYSSVWRRDEQGQWRAELALLGDDTPPPPPVIGARPAPLPAPPPRRR